MVTAHASSSAALIEMFRSGAIGGRRMIPAKGNTNGAPVMIGGVDLMSIVATAVHIARFRTPSGADLVTTLLVAVTSSYFSRRKVRWDFTNETKITKVVLFGGNWAESHHCASVCRRAEVSAQPASITKEDHGWGQIGANALSASLNELFERCWNRVDPRPM